MRGFGEVNHAVQIGERPPWNSFGSVSDRTAAALSDDLGAFGLNVPVPRSHAGRLANATGARLMWARAQIKIRWESDNGKPPYRWRIYAPPQERGKVLQVARDVVADKGQGDVEIRAHINDAGLHPEDRWYLEFSTALPAPQGEDMGAAHAAALAWGPSRWSSYGPPSYRGGHRPGPEFAGVVGRAREVAGGVVQLVKDRPVVGLVIAGIALAGVRGLLAR
jgi:hypothetical protein